MTIIQQALDTFSAALPRIALPIERGLLARRRWRGVAEDGAEFGFDLEAPLRDGDAIFQSETAIYVLAQKYEPVLELRIGSPVRQPPLVPSASSAECGLRNGTEAARVGWLIGNLHFQIEITDDVVRVADDPALRQLFEREHLAFTPCKRVFHPVSGGHHH